MVAPGYGRLCEDRPTANPLAPAVVRGAAAMAYGPPDHQAWASGRECYPMHTHTCTASLAAHAHEAHAQYTVWGQ